MIFYIIFLGLSAKLEGSGLIITVGPIIFVLPGANYCNSVSIQKKIVFCLLLHSGKVIKFCTFGLSVICIIDKSRVILVV